jgi:hypothetical protein
MIASKDGTADTIMQPKREHRPFAYPLWPTSTPGPEVILPPPGQKPLSTRTDQMVYAYYDQEQGMPCVPPPKPVVRENRTRTSLPDVSPQEVEAETMERWLDDSGASAHEAVYDARGVLPLQFLKPEGGSL